MGETEIFTSEFFTSFPYVVDGLTGKGKEWSGSLAQAVRNLHLGIYRRDEKGQSLPANHVPPKIIFVTATTAIPYAYAMKECWRVAFTGDPQPAFDVIDVSDRRFGYQMTGDFHRLLTEEQIQVYDLKEIDKLRREGQRLNAFTSAAVFDEWSNSGTTLRRAADTLKQAGFQDVNFCARKWGMPWAWLPVSEERPVVRDPNEGAPFRGLLIRTGEAQKKLITDMKLVGRLMAQEIVLHSP